MKKVELKLYHDTITGEIVREDSHQWILKDVTIKGIKQIRTFEGYSVPKSMVIDTIITEEGDEMLQARNIRLFAKNNGIKLIEITLNGQPGVKFEYGGNIVTVAKHPKFVKSFAFKIECDGVVLVDTCYTKQIDIIYYVTEIMDANTTSENETVSIEEKSETIPPQKLVINDVTGDSMEIDPFHNYHNTEGYVSFEFDTPKNHTSIILDETGVSKLKEFFSAINPDDVNNISGDKEIHLKDDTFDDVLNIYIGSYGGLTTFVYFECENKLEHLNLNQYTLLEFWGDDIKSIANYISKL